MAHIATEKKNLPQRWRRLWLTEALAGGGSGWRRKLLLDEKWPSDQVAIPRFLKSPFPAKRLPGVSREACRFYKFAGPSDYFSAKSSISEVSYSPSSTLSTMESLGHVDQPIYQTYP